MLIVRYYKKINYPQTCILKEENMELQSLSLN